MVRVSVPDTIPSSHVLYRRSLDLLSTTPEKRPRVHLLADHIHQNMADTLVARMQGKDGHPLGFKNLLWVRIR